MTQTRASNEAEKKRDAKQIVHAFASARDAVQTLARQGVSPVYTAALRQIAERLDEDFERLKKFHGLDRE